ncbi:MAG: M28 family peptidase [Bacteroidales bacterium]|nr:M28 family peptidase [Bacteroidales bacterium]
MKKLLISTFLALGCLFSAYAQDQLKQNLETHLYYFAADSLNGRAAGSADARKAAAYIRGQFESIGLQPLFEDFYHDFEYGNDTYRNVVAVIPGSDETLRHEYIVLGAHYDHLGVRKDGEVYNGADDNASGSSAIIEVARMLMARRSELKRSVIIASFDAEEIGLVGSTKLAQALKDSTVRLMLSADMVGWYKVNGALNLEGTGTIDDHLNVLENSASANGIAIHKKKFEDSILTATDTEGFAQMGIPTLAVDTGLKSPYHKVEDDADLIDFDGLCHVTTFLADVVSAYAADPQFAGSGRVAPKHKPMNKGLELHGGLRAGAGGAQILLPDAAFDCTNGHSYAGGVMLKLDYKYTGIMTGALFNHQKVQFPDPAAPFTDALTFEQNDIRVPVELLLQTRNRISNMYIGFGGWYGYTLPGSGIPYMLDSERHMYGTAWSIGVTLGHFFVQTDVFRSLKTFAEGPSTGITPIPKARLYSTDFTIGLCF